MHAIFTRGRSTSFIEAYAALAVCSNTAPSSIDAGITATAAVHIGLIAIADKIFAGRRYTGGINTNTALAVGSLEANQPSRTSSATTTTIYARLIAILNTITTGCLEANAFAADASDAVS